MWKNFLPINQIVDSSEESYNSVEEDNNPLVSPTRPPQSPRASPRALLVPDPPPVEDVLDAAGRQLRALPDRVRREQQRLAAAAGHNQAVMPDAVDYDAENGADGDKAQDLARSIKIDFEPNDVVFWFSQLEKPVGPEISVGRDAGLQMLSLLSIIDINPVSLKGFHGNSVRIPNFSIGLKSYTNPEIT